MHRLLIKKKTPPPTKKNPNKNNNRVVFLTKAKNYINFIFMILDIKDKIKTEFKS